MLTVRLKELLDEFEEWVVEGRAKKVPYQEWRWLKQHEEDYVRIERDGWGDLGIFSETCCKFLVEGWPFDDNSLGTYLDYIFIHEFDNCLSNKYSQGYYDSNGLAYVKRDDTGFSATNKIDSSAEKSTPVVEITESIQGKNVISTINKKVNEAIGLSINGKENDSMNLFKNFDFGSCENDNVKMSMYGIAVKNANGTWVSYDTKSESVVDVDILNFDAKYLYKMPVAIKDVKAGDVVIHNRKPMFVTIVEDGKLGAIDPAAGEEKVILLTKSMFGFDFVTKIVNFFGDLSATASADAPFGNMLPLMLLADSGKSDDMLPLMFAMGGGKFDMSNPMMLYFLMKDNKNKDILPFMFFANGQGIAFGKTEAEARNNALNN